MDKAKWSGFDTDAFMDSVLDGKTSEEVAIALGRSEELIRAKFKPIFYPETPYKPSGPRLVRTGKPLTRLERSIIAKHREAGYSIKQTALMLMRHPDEIGQTKGSTFVSSTDELVAHHYLYHLSKHPVLPDEEYDEKKARESQTEPGKSVLEALTNGEKGVADYPAHIRSLAHYMLYKHMVRTGRWNHDALPYSWGSKKKENE